MTSLKTIIIACCILLLLSGEKTVAQETAIPPNPILKVFVSILPTEYFVNRIGGERVEVECLVKPGHSPATYSPSPKQMAQLASAQIYFRIGVPFENAFLPKVHRSFPKLTIVDLQQGIELNKIEEHEEDHEHGDIDPHTWLDPMLALKQARNIRDSLVLADPEGREIYDANYRILAAELQSLNQYLEGKLAPFRNSTVYVFHPAYGYFCQAYDLKQKAITPGGKEPGAQYIARLIDQAKKDKVGIIFVQPQFSDKAAKTMAKAINGSVVPLDPLAYDYMDNMKKIGARIAESLSGHIE